MNSEIAEFVKNYLIERGAEINEENWQEYDFISSGVIDSFEILSFLLVLNERYGVKIRPQDFVGTDYKHIGKLVEFVDANTGGRS